MSDEQNLELARRWFEALWSQPNLATADDIVAADYAPDWIQIPKTGPEQVKHEVNYFRSVFPDLQYKIIDAVAQADKVWVRYQGTGTQKGNAWGFAPTNKQVTFSGVTIFTINSEGKIADRWGAFSFYDMFADLGLVPPFWELSQHFSKFDD